MHVRVREICAMHVGKEKTVCTGKTPLAWYHIPLLPSMTDQNDSDENKRGRIQYEHIFLTLRCTQP
jgi:hypothetical protein